MTTALLTKFDDLRASTNLEVIERVDEIDTALIALVARAHCFFLGEPGIAKSHLVNRLMARIAGVRYGVTQFHRLMPYEDVFGPISIPGLKREEYRRVTKGFLPELDVFFGDEQWKAGGSLLNSLLMAYNERKFKQDGDLVDIPLSTVFIASNELPGEDREELSAIYDRIHFRHVVKPISTAGSFVQMLRLKVDANPTPIMTWTDVEEAQAIAATTPVSDDAIDVLVELRRKLKAIGVSPSDRKWRESMKIIAATAFLDGSPEAGPEHLEPLVNVLWDNPEHAAHIEDAVLSMVSPQRKEAVALRDAVLGLAEQVDKAVAEENLGEITTLFSKVKRARGDVTKLSKTAKGKTVRVTTELASTLDNLQRKIVTSMGIDPATLEVAK